MVSNRAHDEATVGVEVVILCELFTSVQRKIRSIDEILMKTITLRIDIVDLVILLAIDDEEDVRQRIGSVRVNARQLVKLSP